MLMLKTGLIRLLLIQIMTMITTPRVKKRMTMMTCLTIKGKLNH